MRKPVNLCGGRFELIGSCGEVVRTGVTDNNGTICFDNLDFGTYYVKEVAAPEGYKRFTGTITTSLCSSHRVREIDVCNEKEVGTIIVHLVGAKNCPNCGENTIAL